MKSRAKSNHVLKSLDALSPDLLGQRAAAAEKTEQQEPRLAPETEQLTNQHIVAAVFEIRGYRGWGINE